MDSCAPVARRTGDGNCGTSVTVFLICDLLAAISHCEAALWVHDAVQGQKQGPRRFSAGPLVSVEFPAHPAGNVRAAHPARVHPFDSGVGVAAVSGDWSLRSSGGRLVAAPGPEAAREAAAELAQTRTIGDGSTVAVDRSPIRVPLWP